MPIQNNQEKPFWQVGDLVEFQKCFFIPMYAVTIGNGYELWRVIYLTEHFDDNNHFGWIPAHNKMMNKYSGKREA